MCHTKSLISKIYPNVHRNTHTPETKYKAILEIEKGVMKWVCDENAPKNLIFNRNYENVDNFQINYRNDVGNSVNDAIC